MTGSDQPGPEKHKTLGLSDPAAFSLPSSRDDASDRRAANRAVAVSVIGLGATGLIKLLLAVLTGSLGLLGDAIPNLSDVSTSAVVFLGFRLSRRPAQSGTPMAWNAQRTWPESGSPQSSGLARPSPVTRASTSSSPAATPRTSPRASPGRSWASSATWPWPATNSSSQAYQLRHPRGRCPALLARCGLLSWGTGWADRYAPPEVGISPNF